MVENPVAEVGRARQQRWCEVCSRSDGGSSLGSTLVTATATAAAAAAAAGGTGGGSGSEDVGGFG